MADLGRGRALFNQGDFWGSHEALEAAWQRSSDPGNRAILQGLIQAGAAFHKLLVHDNARGALLLLDRSLDKLAAGPERSFGLALQPLRAHLHRWRERIQRGNGIEEPVAGLPEISWSRVLEPLAIQVDGATIREARVGDARCILVELRSGEHRGFGECRFPWGGQATWEALQCSLIPGLLTENVIVPSEMPVVWAEVSDNLNARAGLEAALWDLWSKRHGIDLTAMVGATTGHVELAARLPALDLPLMRSRAALLEESGFRHLVLPARPKADRRLLPALVSSLGVAFSIELGARYREADVLALRALALLGPDWMGDPSPADLPRSAVRLRRWIDAPIARGGGASVEAMHEAYEVGTLDILRIEVERVGLDAARRMLDAAESMRLPAFVTSRAVTDVGLAADLAMARHPAATLPLELVGRGGDDLPLLLPAGEDGSEGEIVASRLGSMTAALSRSEAPAPGITIRRSWRIEA